MCELFERALVTHCAPTLAGHKCGSLFTWIGCPGIDPSLCVAEADALLRSKGLRVCMLKHAQDRSLVYAYRPSKLHTRLSDPAVRRFLQRKGYGCVSVSDDLGHLAARVHSSSEFPHEIGVFLDYPLDDVIRFIEQRGRGYRCSGCWKAYSNEQEARRRFELYDKCHRIYLSCHLRGFDVMRLTVAA